MTDVYNPYATHEFQPYVAAIGQLSLAWNDLHDSLAAIFLLSMGDLPREGDQTNEAPIDVWNTIRSDRVQRDMLRAVAANPPSHWHKSRPRFGSDCIWLIDKTNDIANWRNDAIHSPLYEAGGILMLLFDNKEPVRPNPFYRNPRAVSLSKRENILLVFHYCRDASILLTDFARKVHRAMVSHDRAAWPEKPIFPARPTNSDQYQK